MVRTQGVIVQVKLQLGDYFNNRSVDAKRWFPSTPVTEASAEIFFKQQVSKSLLRLIRLVLGRTPETILKIHQVILMHSQA